MRWRRIELNTIARHLSDNLQSRRSYLQAQFPAIWSRMVTSFATYPDDAPPTMWTCYTSSLLLRVHTLRCAIDLSFRNTPVGHESLCLERTLPPIDLFMLTHLHGDHYDAQLIRFIEQRGKTAFLVPSPLVERIRQECDLEKAHIKPISDRETVQIGGLQLRAFRTRHVNIPDSFGYVLDVGQERMVLPGDIRDYATNGLPALERVDCLLFNVWLGRQRALSFDPTWIEAACTFIAHFLPRRVLFSHLYDVSRPPEDAWTFIHAGWLQDRLLTVLPETRCYTPYLGEPVSLSIGRK